MFPCLLKLICKQKNVATVQIEVKILSPEFHKESKFLLKDASSLGQTDAFQSKRKYRNFL